MNTLITIRPAERTKAKLRVGLSGPSGSGKTYSALLLASGMATDWSKVALIDTENGSGDLYSHLGAYNVVTLNEPYSPEHYIEAIAACENAGMEVIIIDSVTHEWDGKGGCLEINDALANAKFKGNTWSAWSQTTPRHQRFIDAITRSKCHVITTVRNKQDTVQVDGKVKKVGTKEIQREGFEYELTLNLNLDRDRNTAIASKDRTGLFTDADPFRITPDTGKTLLAWANDGKELPKPLPQERPTAIKEAQGGMGLAPKYVTFVDEDGQTSQVDVLDLPEFDETELRWQLERLLDRAQDAKIIDITKATESKGTLKTAKKASIIAGIRKYASLLEQSLEKATPKDPSPSSLPNASSPNLKALMHDGATRNSD